ncbi:sensor histidine kinase [Chlorobium sp. BLA1]|uniref:two-component system sensor histidine kinase NtrB n=1 Tax=Candidatus Chlorobium masyuteum TaxID=2716876 RepID=UPI00142398DE|nr:ATP-binding protein [Candidatus Chlorobium masyuteum]NHQ61015.1 sensor histidine kinase [Candidatus Chlorobium masyuteum]
METATRIRTLSLAASVIAISLLHYLTPLQLPYLHDIFQRLYYLPIILSGLWFGFRGGLFCSLFVSILYAPHILYQWGGHPGMEMEKYLEILLYNTVGTVTGMLSQRERERTGELQKSSRELTESYRKLQEQSAETIIIEEQLRRAEKLSTLGEMAAVLAHEIRNPLSSIRGTAEILRDDYPTGNPKHEFIDIQIRETERLNRVVEEFLHMARQQPMAMKPCWVQDELETIVTLVMNDARKRQVALQLQPNSVAMIVMADSEKLRQAFLNIIINALQATPEGGRVTISTTIAEHAFCEIRFRDSGPGVEKAAMERIFEPFFTTKSDGTGLGLAITKNIIENHKGTLKVESEAANGTTVTIRLPLQLPQPGEAT